MVHACYLNVLPILTVRACPFIARDRASCYVLFPDIGNLLMSEGGASDTRQGVGGHEESRIGLRYESGNYKRRL